MFSRKPGDSKNKELQFKYNINMAVMLYCPDKLKFNLTDITILDESIEDNVIFSDINYCRRL